MKKKWNEIYKKSRDVPWRKTDVDLSGWLKKANIFSGCALDLGCGTGEKSKWLAEHKFNVEGLDFSKEALKIARKLSSKPHFIEWDLEKLNKYSFEHKKYDLIIDAKTFRSIENKKLYLDTIKFRLRGTFILQVFLRHKEKPFLAINEKEIEKLIASNFVVKRKDLYRKSNLAMAEYFLK